MFILPGRAQLRPALAPVQVPDLSAQFEYLLHVVWTCERWWTFEDHVDQLLEAIP